MNFRRYFPKTLCVALSLLPVAAVAGDIFEDGPVDAFPGSDREEETWQAQETVLPAWPGESEDLIELNVSTEGLPYRVYVDPVSLTTGEDRVVRFTTVIVSSTGVRNVTYEGLHCGEKNFRRLAYGIDGEWYPLRDTDWQRISGTGIYQYRKLLYENYLCDSAARYREADELVRRLRNRNPIINVD